MRTPEPEFITRVYRTMAEAYGPQHWWPGDTPLEVVVGAVLTQNTAWHNVAVAVLNLKNAGLLTLEALLEAPADAVREAIRPSGFYNVKYVRLLGLLQHIAARGGIEALAAQPSGEVRAGLLGVSGVGHETADTVLLYALDKPAFVIDSYTRRLFSRLGRPWAETVDYHVLQRWFVDSLPQDVPLYYEYHALIVQHCKTHCRKTPRCEGCPLNTLCAWYAENRTRELDTATLAAR